VIDVQDSVGWLLSVIADPEMSEAAAAAAAAAEGEEEGEAAEAVRLDEVGEIAAPRAWSTDTDEIAGIVPQSG